jgi:hypothetical protein
VQRRIALAIAPRDEGEKTHTGAVAGVDPSDPETAVTDLDTTLETIDVDATIVSDALDGVVNVSGEQTWSAGGTRAIDAGAEHASPPEDTRTVQAPLGRHLHDATTASLEARSVATTVDPPRRSLWARMAVPIALLLLVAGVGIGAWVGLRTGEVRPGDTTAGDGSIAVPLDPPPATHGATVTDPRDGTGARSAAHDETSAAAEDEPVDGDENRAPEANPDAVTPGAEAADDARTGARRSHRQRSRRTVREPTEEPATEPAVAPGTLLGPERYPQGAP